MLTRCLRLQIHHVDIQAKSARRQHARVRCGMRERACVKTTEMLYDDDARASVTRVMRVIPAADASDVCHAMLFFADADRDRIEISLWFYALAFTTLLFSCERHYAALLRLLPPTCYYVAQHRMRPDGGVIYAAFDYVAATLRHIRYAACLLDSFALPRRHIMPLRHFD